MATFVRAATTAATCDPIFIFVERKKQHVFVAKMKLLEENTKMMHRYSLSLNNMM